MKGNLALKRIRNLIIDDVREKLDSLSGEFSVHDEARIFRAALGELNLNDHADEIAFQLAKSEDELRTKKGVPGNVDLFTEGLASQMFIPLGDLLRVKCADATWAHWQKKQAAQDKAITIAEQARNNTESLLEKLRQAGMQNSPTMTTAQAMRKLGFW